MWDGEGSCATDAAVEVADQASVDEAWTDEISTRVDDVLNGEVTTIPGEQVFAELAARRTERQAAHNA